MGRPIDWRGVDFTLSDEENAKRLGCSAGEGFRSCVDWQAEGWKPWKKASPGARKRIEAAAARLGTPCLSQHVTGHRGVPLHEPIRTITGQDHWILVGHGTYRPLTIRELARGMGFPEHYTIPEKPRAASILGLGNAVCPRVARDLVCLVGDA